MVVRVFDASQVRCSCVLEIPERGRFALDVLKISKVGGLLKAAPDLSFPKDSRYRARLVLTAKAGTTVELEAAVVSSVNQRVGVRWRHRSAEDADRLEAALGGCVAGEASQSHPPRVLSQDGRVDVKATLISRSEAVAAEELAMRKRTLRVLQMSAVNGLIEEIVDEALAGLSQLDAERGAVVETRQFTVSDESILKLERRLGRLVDRAVRDGEVGPETEQQMREVMARLLDEEREKIRASAQTAQSEAILILERKVGRLAHSLAQARKERDRARQRAAALEMSSGSGRGNVMTPGLDEDDPSRALKQSLLEELARDNHWLREQIREQVREQVRKRVQGQFRGRVPGAVPGPVPGPVPGEPLIE